MSKSWFLVGGAAIIVIGTGYFMWPAFMMPDWMYDLRYGGRYPAVTTVGDGQLTDHGPRAAIDQYVIDLGPVDLSTKSNRTYSLKDLPAVRLTIGLDITSRDRGVFLKTQGPRETLVGITVVNEASELVIDEEAPLKNWTWSYWLGREYRSFVYRAGETKRIELGREATTYKAIGLKADGGWGTYFHPRPKGRYALAIKIGPERKPHSDLEVRLHAHGGGWKASAGRVREGVVMGTASLSRQLRAPLADQPFGQLDDLLHLRCRGQSQDCP